MELMTIKFADVFQFEDFTYGGFEYQKVGKRGFNENADEYFGFDQKSRVHVWRYSVR